MLDLVVEQGIRNLLVSFLEVHPPGSAATVGQLVEVGNLSCAIQQQIVCLERDVVTRSSSRRREQMEVDSIVGSMLAVSTATVNRWKAARVRLMQKEAHIHRRGRGQRCSDWNVISNDQLRLILSDCHDALPCLAPFLRVRKLILSAALIVSLLLFTLVWSCIRFTDEIYLNVEWNASP